MARGGLLNDQKRWQLFKPRTLFTIAGCHVAYTNMKQKSYAKHPVRFSVGLTQNFGEISDLPKTFFQLLLDLMTVSGHYKYCGWVEAWFIQCLCSHCMNHGCPEMLQPGFMFLRSLR